MKYIYFANDAREQLFNVSGTREVRQRIADTPDVADRLRDVAVEACKRPNVNRALDEHGLRSFPFEARPLQRILQFDRSRGVTGFPKNPADALGAST